jgi:hypothetical protein
VPDLWVEPLVFGDAFAAQAFLASFDQDHNQSRAPQHKSIDTKAFLNKNAHDFMLTASHYVRAITYVLNRSIQMKTFPHRLFIVDAITLFLLAGGLSIAAQAPNNSTASASASPQSTSEGIQKRDNEWGIWGGISFNSPTLIGKTPNAKYGHIGLRYGRVLAASKTVAFEWTIDAVPLALLSTERSTALLFPPPGGFVTRPRNTVYGAGAAPIGLKFNFRRNRRVQPFGQATGGFLYFSEQVPITNASQFNFTFDFSGGVQIVNSNRRSWTIGYKYHHISNGNTGFFNPGVDVQMIFAGFSVFR